MLLCNRPYPCVVESKTIKRQLKVEIFVQLWIRCVNAALQVATILRSTFIEIPVQEVFPELKQSCRCYCVCSAIIMMSRRFAWLYTIIWICKKTKRERKITLWIKWWIICIDFARWVFFLFIQFWMSLQSNVMSNGILSPTSDYFVYTILHASKSFFGSDSFYVVDVVL